MVEISENAGKLINKMVARHGFAQGGLRIGIKAGGCSGLSYVFDWEPAAKDGDHVFEGPEDRGSSSIPRASGSSTGRRSTTTRAS
jgi:Fe-S cluster assembly iron-binding protein IscA